MAKQVLGKAPGNVEVIGPMKDGVVAYFTDTKQILKQFLSPARIPGLYETSPRIVVICVPPGST